MYSIPIINIKRKKKRYSTNTGHIKIRLTCSTFVSALLKLITIYISDTLFPA